MNRAIFLDRDGTLVHRREYPRRPEELVLFDGVGPALYRLQREGWKLVVITNQGGMAFGYFDRHMLERMHNALAEQLRADFVQLDGIYSCPHHPRGTIPALAVPCQCRKPEPGLLLQAASELDIDLAQSWMIGDMLSDVEVGNRAGCRTVLVGQYTYWPETEVQVANIIAPNTVQALEMLL